MRSAAEYNVIMGNDSLRSHTAAILLGDPELVDGWLTDLTKGASRVVRKTTHAGLNVAKASGFGTYVDAFRTVTGGKKAGPPTLEAPQEAGMSVNPALLLGAGVLLIAILMKTRGGGQAQPAPSAAPLPGGK